MLGSENQPENFFRYEVSLKTSILKDTMDIRN